MMENLFCHCCSGGHRMKHLYVNSREPCVWCNYERCGLDIRKPRMETEDGRVDRAAWSHPAIFMIARANRRCYRETYSTAPCHRRIYLGEIEDRDMCRACAVFTAAGELDKLIREHVPQAELDKVGYDASRRAYEPR